MEATDGRSVDRTEPEDDEQPTVTTHQCSSDRVVFVEADNSDAWIATDRTVDPAE